MKITILKENFKEGLLLLEKITKKTLSLPILENFLLESEKNLLKLSSTNLESGIIFRCLSKIENEGKICIPVKNFLNFLQFLPNKPLFLEVKDFVLFLECGNYNTKIKGLNPNDFPIIPQPKEKEIIIISSKVFCQSLNQVINIPSYLLSKPEISGVFISFQSNLIKMVATDSFRLVEKKILQNFNIEKEYSLILPQSTAKEIIAIFGNKEGGLKIYLSPNQIFFEYGVPEISRPKFNLLQD